MIIHLGDIYYAGTPSECDAITTMMQQVWREEHKLGKVPFYSIPGNHDYYSYGYGFYPFVKEINSKLGFTDEAYYQHASYFCLRTEDNAWQFLGMDTGISDYEPMNQFILDAPKLRCSEEIWHEDKLKNFKGKTILLSHHQLFSANTKITGDVSGDCKSDHCTEHYVNEKLLKVFSPHFKNIPVWFWRHEHNLVVFDEFKYKEFQPLCKGRLIGCSGFEEFEKQDPYSENCKGFEIKIKRNSKHEIITKLGMSPGCEENSTKSKYYNHGYVIVDLGSNNIEYYQYPSWGDYCIPHKIPDATAFPDEPLVDKIT